MLSPVGAARLQAPRQLHAVVRASSGSTLFDKLSGPNQVPPLPAPPAA